MLMKSAQWRIRGRPLAGVLGAIGIALGLASWVLGVNYEYTKPPSPNTADGRVYPLNIHGYIVYLNTQEQYFLYGLQVVAGLFFVSGISVDVISSRRKTGTDGPNPDFLRKEKGNP